MKILFNLLLLTVLLSAVWGWTAIELTDNSTDHPGHCYSKSEEVGAMKNGEVKSIKGQCAEVSCGGDTTMYYVGCGSISGPPKCRVTDVDLSKLYPDCCPKLECP